MDASEFNKLYDEIIINPLIKEYGFKKKNLDIFYDGHGYYLALIRQAFRGSRYIHVFLCLRHPFVRDLYDRTGNLFEHDPNGYPFKISPFEISIHNYGKWHYVPRFGRYDGETINYGEDYPFEHMLLTPVEKDVPSLLQRMFDQIVNVGFKWAEMLTPFEAYKQLRKYNDRSRTELDWIEDYEDYFNK